MLTQPASPGVPLSAASTSLDGGLGARERGGAGQLDAEDRVALVLLGQEAGRQAREAGAADAEHAEEQHHRDDLVADHEADAWPSGPWSACRSPC